MNSAQQNKAEFGDFQTPLWFARDVCTLLSAQNIVPRSILEPTCGLGSLLLAALDEFETPTLTVGADINLTYVEALRREIAQRNDAATVEIIHTDFFYTDWPQILKTLPDPLLIIGNPPWVTNTELATLGSGNLPPKHNFQHHSGIEAITGTSNFDISEWMLLKVFDWISERQGVVAMLCKTTVARKVLRQTWQQEAETGVAHMYLLDAQKVFNAAVDACVLIYDTRLPSKTKSCQVCAGVTDQTGLTKIGYRHGQLIANVEYYDRWHHLAQSKTGNYQWRSGIKHDCAKVMELQKSNGAYVNKLGERWELESAYLYPMLKSSDIAGAKNEETDRWMIVPQRTIGENTRSIQLNAPKTWRYLTKHAALLDRRKSSIYKNRPRFSIFGVGDYAFAPWKVAISGLYKHLTFTVVGPTADKPTVLDDTCYFLACQSEAEARLLVSLLNSEPAQQFYEAFIFWDAKRPITAKILRKLDLFALAAELGQREVLEEVTNRDRPVQAEQLRLLEEDGEYTSHPVTSQTNNTYNRSTIVMTSHKSLTIREAELSLIRQDTNFYIELINKLQYNQSIGVIVFGLIPYLSLFTFETYRYLKDVLPTYAHSLSIKHAEIIKSSRMRTKFFDDKQGQLEDVFKLLEWVSDFHEELHINQHKGFLASLKRALQDDLGIFAYNGHVIGSTHTGLLNLGYEKKDLPTKSEGILPAIRSLSFSISKELGGYLGQLSNLPEFAFDKSQPKIFSYKIKDEMLGYKDVKSKKFFGTIFNGTETQEINFSLMHLLATANFMQHILKNMLIGSPNTFFKLKFITLYHLANSLQKLQSYCYPRELLTDRSKKYFQTILKDKELKTIKSEMKFRNILVHYKIEGVSDERLISNINLYGLVENFFNGTTYDEMNEILDNQIERVSYILEEWLNWQIKPGQFYRW